MVPARNLLRRHCDSYGACFSGGDPRFHDLDGLSSLKLNKLMADEPSPAPEDEQFGRDDGGSGDWLQLGLGTPPPLVPTDAAPGRTATTQLELFSARPSSSASPGPGTCPVAWPGVSGFRAPMMGMAMTMVPWMSHRREMPWGRCNPNLAMGGSSATTTLPPVMPEFVARQFVYPIPGSATPSGPEVLPEMRVVTPPRRPQSGVWIMLQAARDQGREPFLPQIPRSYLRIKDGRMTVGLLMKYLVNKLGLENAHEVEITCREQLLLPFLTLLHVRDNIWRSTEETTTTTTLLRDSGSGTDHVMMLQYGRSAYTEARSRA
ncbi:protein LAX PANICLE 2-like [Musa acuminata AAA Group]|uniref:protein LAX PANICLE 2-like n=1 Tax=Musa acuminata AAA Group TaxID=214697 RepID=UPI0031D090B9